MISKTIEPEIPGTTNAADAIIPIANTIKYIYHGALIKEIQLFPENREGITIANTIKPPNQPNIYANIALVF